jgi:hypothetical protein
VNRISRFQRITLWCFALGLVFAQALGVAHRTVHLDLRIIGYDHASHGHEHSHSHSHNHDHAPGEDCASHGRLASLFAGHEEGDESCRLLDANLKSEALNSPLASVFIAPGALFLIAFAQAQLIALRAAQAQARAPPL